MAFKNEDLAIHLSEQFEQDVWGLYAQHISAWDEHTHNEKREYQREYIKRPGKREQNNKNGRAYHARFKDIRNAKSKEWCERNKERMRELRKAWKERNREKVLQADREYQAKKRAERLAAAQQLSVNQP